MNSEAKGCAFQATDPTACGKPVLSDYKYCEHHLRPLTGVYVRATVIEAICDLLEVSARSNITNETRLVEDLRADSLVIVEGLVLFEEEFGFEITDDEVPDNLTIGEIVKLIITKLETAGRYVQEPRGGLYGKLEHAKDRPGAVNHQIRTILSSELFKDYMVQLGLHRESLLRIMSGTVRDWVEHITTVPHFTSSIGNSQLTGVDIILLTKRNVLQYFIDKERAVFTHTPLEISDIRCEYRYDKNGALIEVQVIAIDPRTRPRDIKLEYSFATDVGINGVMVFMEKYLQLKAKRMHS